MTNRCSNNYFGSCKLPSTTICKRCGEDVCEQHPLCSRCAEWYTTPIKEIISCLKCKENPLIKCKGCKRLICKEHRSSLSVICRSCYRDWIFFEKPILKTTGRCLLCLLSSIKCVDCGKRMCINHIKEHTFEKCEGFQRWVRLMRKKQNKK